MVDILDLAKKARRASFEYAVTDTAQKNKALLAIAAKLRANKDEIYKVNASDVENAALKKLNPALVDRLKLTEARFEEMVLGVEQVAKLNDPVGRYFDGRTLANGLRIEKKSVPLGVVGVIYESRPNVTVDIAALCLKSGNAAFLRGGSESLATNKLLHKLICEALEESGLNSEGICLIPEANREHVSTMLSLNEYIDVLIPRGGEALQRRCQRESSIPVIIGGFGISHIFVDKTASLEKSVDIIINAKTQKPSACNSLDTLLVHEDIAKEFIAMLIERLKEYKVKVIAHKDAFELFKGYDNLQEGKDEDFANEFLSLTMNVALVKDVFEVVEHMRHYGASHSDAILTDSKKNADIFVNSSGSACVYVNASTRFSDGGQFGLGAEVAISTQKLHARGPLGLDALTTYQYVCDGDYLSRA